ncbi:piggyBac transposable element-derived protein 4-like [Watersipora subatra]|uniref:piggyBac transposable element-derived protein 4-like n=1 Tax=Watersipora subatra TaxID=2589382 RepID=UPI00355BE23F
MESRFLNASNIAISSGEEDYSDDGEYDDTFEEHLEEQGEDVGVDHGPRASTPQVDHSSSNDVDMAYMTNEDESSTRSEHGDGDGTRGGSRGRGRGSGALGGRQRGRRGRGQIGADRTHGGAGAPQTQQGGWQWQKNTPQQNREIPFSGTPGLKVRMPQDASLLDYFKLFLTDEIMNFYLVETNRFGNSKHQNWQPINMNDLQRFFALIMLTGIIKKPTLQSYFSTDPKLATPLFNSVMSRDKFMKILNALHFVDNDLAPTSRIHRISPIIHLLNRRFESVYRPKKHIAIDETLLLFKGRLIFKQYIPKKRARFGMKGYVLAESDTGYVCRYSLYQGRDRENADISQGVAHRIVLDMMDGFLNNGHELFMDNWYTSPQLLKELYERGTYAYGTLRSNRKHVPKDIKNFTSNQPLAKGQSQYFTCPPVLTGCWRDKNFIVFGSNKHSDFILKTLEKRTWNDREIVKPGPIIDYNKYMGGVDLADQCIKYYNMDRRSLKWYKKLFFHLLDIATHNTHVVYKQNTGTTISALDFRLKLVDLLLNEAGPDPTCTGGQRGRPRSIGTDLARLNTNHHFPSFNPATSSRGNPVARRCRVCNASRHRTAGSTDRKRVETKYCCAECGNIPFCPVPCFRRWHTERDLL